MDANQLLFYLRGVFESETKFTAAKISALRAEILRAQPVKPEIIPVEVVNPIKKIAGGGNAPMHDCNCNK